MKVLSYAFFYGYVTTLIIAGAWGAAFAPLDHRWLFHIDVRTVAAPSAASLLSQYRFLRAVECGFGVFCVLFRREIWTQRVFNRLFLGTMASGVVVRILSRLSDGTPYPAFDFFAAYEFIGVVLIATYSRRTLKGG